MSTAWPVQRLGAVATVSAGNSAPQDKSLFAGGTHTFIRTSDVGQIRVGEIRDSADKLNDLGVRGMRKFREGVTLVPKSGASTFNNHRVITAVEATVSSHLAVVDAHHGVLDDRYVFYFLQTVRAQDLIGDQSYPSLNLTHLESVEIPVPPLAEQQRIVAKLDETRSLTRQLLAAGEKARTALTDLRRSWMRSELENAGSSMVMELGSFCDIYQPQTIGVKDLVEDGDFEVFGANGRIGRFNRYNHEESEVTVTCRGATCGTVNVTPPKVWITGNAMVIRPKPEVMTKEMLAVVMRSLDYSGVITGAAQPQITRRTLAPTVVPVLPLPEQHLVVERIENAQQLTSDLAMAWESKLRFVRDLEQSMLAAAFRGDL